MERERSLNFQTDRKLVHVQSYPRIVEPELNSCYEIHILRINMTNEQKALISKALSFLLII